jgi:hypothetical protein
MRWFRFHADALNNPKVQRLHPQVFRAWVNILCIACERSGDVPCVCDLAFLTRTDEAFMQRAIDALIEARLIEQTATGYIPHDWNEHQYHKASDEPARVNERVTRYRALRNADGNAGVTRPDTEQNRLDTETKEKRTETESAAKPPPIRAKRATPIPQPFELNDEMYEWAEREMGFDEDSVRRETTKFINYYLGNGKPMKDWRATWENWLIRASENKVQGQWTGRRR